MSSLTQFLDYCKKGKLEQVKQFIDNGFDIHSKNYQQTNGIINACMSKNLELVKYLHSKGADLNSYNKKHSTLIRTIEFQNLEIMNYLLENGVNPYYHSDENLFKLILLFNRKTPEPFIDLLIKYNYHWFDDLILPTHYLTMENSKNNILILNKMKELNQKMIITKTDYNCHFKKFIKEEEKDLYFIIKNIKELFNEKLEKIKNEFPILFFKIQNNISIKQKWEKILSFDFYNFL